MSSSGVIMPTEYRLVSTLRTKFSRHAVGQQPGRRKVVLHHGHVAVGRFLSTSSVLPFSMSLNSTFWYFLASVKTAGPVKVE
jgi:hypothetical protein